MTQVALIHPNFSYHDEGIFNRIWPPLSLAVSAAILEENGHNVNIIDAHALGLSPIECVEQIMGEDMVFMTTTSLDKWQCPHFNRIG